MGIAMTQEGFLQSKAVPFDLLKHRYTEGSFNTAKAAKIPLRNLAKAVVFRDEDFFYTIAIIPSNYKVRRHTLNQIFDRSLTLADAEEVDALFKDCAPGAVPVLAQAYGRHIIWDDQLLDAEEIWMEAGDHEHLIHISKEGFEHLMSDHMHATFSLLQPSYN